MNDKNRMSRTEYILWHIFCSVLILWTNSRVMAENGVSVWQRLGMAVFYVGLVVLGGAAGCLRRRNWVYISATLAFPYAVYALIATWSGKKWALFTAKSAGVLMAVYVVMMLCRRIQQPERRKEILRRRLRYSILGARTIFSMCFLMFFTILTVANWFTGGEMETPAMSANLEEAFGEENSLAHNIEVISKLDQSTWETLDREKRLEVLQVVANVERRYLGLPNPLTVETKDLNDNELGHYNEETYTIVIDTGHLENGEAARVLNTICHEAYHSYEFRLVDVYLNTEPENRNLMCFYKSSIYYEEFQDYHSGHDSEDKAEYYYQLVEVDAREYAKTAVQEYYLEIAEYLEE